MENLSKLTYFSNCASKALTYEVTLTPKPGLVDCANNGAHDDMTITSFLDSITALEPYLKAYIQIGFEHYLKDPTTIFDLLRKEGLRAEKAMFKATQGINTHKGINFSLALLLGATGTYLAQHPVILERGIFSAEDSQAVCQAIIPMTSQLIERDLGNLQSKTELSYGEKLYLNYGIKGPRGEASAGYPSLTKKALPFLRKKAKTNPDKHSLQLELLLYLMTFVEDSNLIHRGGISALKKVQADSRLLMEQELAGQGLEKALSDYNDKLVSKHLSPGGSADLLALSLYFAFLEKLI
ncbi:triphosphoribosyl-dephospho-CoA synthase CitG [Streptococcus didelphis]|uniref:triphosphoribosyl-dephospho-CoA synthase CitG n=1 Tax=Streptococcus didelphis TaxID=102886 RepID=UPI00037C3C3A|nr:triphosphoribosyl-dephospho-CoA synthase CitG [Streptococcus didelphis]